MLLTPIAVCEDVELEWESSRLAGNGVDKKNCSWEKMSLWVDKHRPTSLSKLDYHKEQAQWLKRLVGLL